ncbi:Co2+/Mg2+ efflux protein ApaG [Aestuariibacter salexigens]|uniref:Co2+/Mg2+ efflux protein ApaG n=1 Tax=Aestuariibacter salexigens TaxID=226010 RepID=UPI000423D903|nr:Co2+/Mg2+ efflux protein ApaG [Aestuariibacter salexigens]
MAGPASHNIHIQVSTKFLQDRLPNEPDKFAFAYRVAIHNGGQHQVQLLNRYWLITDANGKKTEVRGPGVVGEQPHIPAGETFVYTSGAVLDTPVGTMEGYYEMEDEFGVRFEAPIDVFSLAIPNVIN